MQVSLFKTKANTLRSSSQGRCSCIGCLSFSVSVLLTAASCDAAQNVLHVNGPNAASAAPEPGRTPGSGGQGSYVAARTLTWIDMGVLHGHGSLLCVTWVLPLGTAFFGFTSSFFVPVLLTAYLLTIVATCNMPLTAAMRGAICRWCRASVVTVPTTRHRKVSSKAHSNINQQEAMLSAKAAQFLPKMHCGVVRTRHFSVYACLWQEDCFAMSCSLKHQFVRASLFSLMQGNSAVSTCSISGLPALPWCTRGGGMYRIVWR